MIAFDEIVAWVVATAHTTGRVGPGECPSGAGKTMTVKIIDNELGLDL